MVMGMGIPGLGGVHSPRHEEGATLETCKGFRRKAHVEKISIVRKFARSLDLKETARGKTTDAYDVASHLATFLEYAIDHRSRKAEGKITTGDRNEERPNAQKRARMTNNSDGGRTASDTDDELKGDVRIFYTKLYQPPVSSRIREEQPSGIAIDSLHLRFGNQWVVSDNSKSWFEVRHLLEDYAGRVMDPLKFATGPKDMPVVLKPGSICRITGIKAKIELNGIVSLLTLRYILQDCRLGAR
jgi:hypothetical protein